MKIFGKEIIFNTKKKQIEDVLRSEGKRAAYNKYLELCKGHKLTDAIKYVDRVAAKPK
ncbi:hypothetical protein [uncultured Metabacillus sp.]|uniref:hypothetical protein n=1 Tax=uncultured Metabacillus sp. TaxID=2860135 RepID=UPI00261825BF|nr:hypothetical protein [uncultured Metabacillus sp.]